MLSILGLFTSCSNDNDPNLPSINYTNAEDLFNEVGFQGYAIVTKNGNDILRKGFGLANKNTSLPQDYNLMYRLGSVSKTLTAAAIVQLKRDGFIYSFHQTLYEFDAAFPNGNQITIAQLLAHQSGIPEYQIVVENAFENGEILNETDIYNLITDLISENGLNFTPGSNKQYCNSNYFIAAMLVEQLTGIPYHQYIQQHIFTPLTMSNSFKGATEINVNTHAQGYFNGTVNSTYPMTIPFGAGDFSSTPKDMETWVNAVKSDWFTATEKNEIFADNIPSGFVDFGLGWFTTQEGNTTMYWHGGDINGYWSMIGFIPAFDACIVLLSNQQDNTGAQRQTIIQQLLTNEFN
jgi:CubicO group peptidase (beta-lactamase class C family)